MPQAEFISAEDVKSRKGSQTVRRLGMRLAVVNVGDDGKVANVILVHMRISSQEIDFPYYDTCLSQKSKAAEGSKLCQKVNKSKFHKMPNRTLAMVEEKC